MTSLLHVTSDAAVPRTAKRSVLASLWMAVLVSSVALAEVHVAAAAAALGAAALASLVIVFVVPVAPEQSARPAH